MPIREGIARRGRGLFTIGAGAITLAFLSHGCSSDEASGGTGGSPPTAGKGGTAANGGAGGATGGKGSAGTSGAGANGGTAGSTNGGGAGTSGGSGGSGGSTGGSSGATSGGSGGSGAGEAGGDMGGAAGVAQGGSAGAAAGTGGTGTAGSAGSPTGWTPTFQTMTLSSDHYAEGADVGDINDDGVLDLVAGPIWYAGPDFTVGGQLFDPVPTFTRDQYSTFFLTFVADLDGDDLPDVIGVGDAGGGNGSGTPNAYWYKNPGPANLGDDWVKTPIYGGLVSNESPIFDDLLGTSAKELVFMTNQRLGYAVPGASATAAWTFQQLSNTSFGTPYVHGLGVGDVNGDGRRDVVERSGWWEQPASGTTWTQHEVDFGEPLGSGRPNNWGGAQMAVYDVDGDGDSDIVTALAAHRYGLYWYEQVDADTFTPHEILPTSATATSISQLHSLATADMNGDGLLDVVAGKRYYAHPSSNADPGTNEPPLIQWFELGRDGGVTFTPHTIHDDSGAGCNFVVLDVTGEGKPDVFTTNKRGTFLHAQR